MTFVGTAGWATAGRACVTTLEWEPTTLELELLLELVCWQCLVTVSVQSSMVVTSTTVSHTVLATFLGVEVGILSPASGSASASDSASLLLRTGGLGTPAWTRLVVVSTTAEVWVAVWVVWVQVVVTTSLHFSVTTTSS